MKLFLGQLGLAMLWCFQAAAQETAPVEPLPDVPVELINLRDVEPASLPPRLKLITDLIDGHPALALTQDKSQLRLVASFSVIAVGGVTALMGTVELRPANSELGIMIRSDMTASGASGTPAGAKAQREATAGLVERLFLAGQLVEKVRFIQSLTKTSDLNELALNIREAAAKFNPPPGAAVEMTGQTPPPLEKVITPGSEQPVEGRQNEQN